MRCGRNRFHDTIVLGLGGVIPPGHLNQLLPSLSSAAEPAEGQLDLGVVVIVGAARRRCKRWTHSRRVVAEWSSADEGVLDQRSPQRTPRRAARASDGAPCLVGALPPSSPWRAAQRPREAAWAEKAGRRASAPRLPPQASHRRACRLWQTRRGRFTPAPRTRALRYAARRPREKEARAHDARHNPNHTLAPTRPRSSKITLLCQHKPYYRFEPKSAVGAPRPRRRPVGSRAF